MRGNMMKRMDLKIILSLSSKFYTRYREHRIVDNKE